MNIVNHPVRRGHGWCGNTRASQGTAHHRRRYFRRVLQDPIRVWRRRISRFTSCRSRPTRWAKSCIPFRFSASVCQLRPEKSRFASNQERRPGGARREIRIKLSRNRNRSRCLIEGLKVLRKILSAPALKPYGRRGRSGSKDFKRRGIAEFLAARPAARCIIRHRTCRMGNDPLAVAISGFALRGIEGLRVVDASIMPDLMSGNTNAPTLLSPRKLLILILEDGALA